MRQNPDYRSPNTHTIFVGNSPFEPAPYDEPRWFQMTEAHGTLVCGGFAPEPPVNSRTRRKAPDPVPSANAARKLNRKYYNKKRKVKVGTNPPTDAWGMGLSAARYGGKNPFNVVTEPDDWDDWNNGFRSYVS